MTFLVCKLLTMEPGVFFRGQVHDFEHQNQLTGSIDYLDMFKTLPLLN